MKFAPVRTSLFIRSRSSFRDLSTSVRRAAGPNNEFVISDAIISCRIRNNKNDSKFAQLEFLTKIPNQQSIWLSAIHVSEDLRSDYEEAWWKACREGRDELKLKLKTGGDVLVLARDKQMRSGLHYACGLGDVEAVQAIINCGAEVDAQDIDGYTPLHIAAGYLHERVIRVLMDCGADPSLEDNSGRSALTLIETLLQKTPATTASFSKRLEMEAVAGSLRSYMFEEIVPETIVQKRTSADSRGQFLVSWIDGFEPIWIEEMDVADDLVDEFDRGIERARVARVLNTQRLGIDHSLIKWADDSNLLSWSEK